MSKEVIVRIKCSGCEPKYYKEKFTEDQCNWVKDHPHDEGLCVKCSSQGRDFLLLDVALIRTEAEISRVDDIAKKRGISDTEVLMCLPPSQVRAWKKIVKEEERKKKEKLGIA